MRKIDQLDDQLDVHCSTIRHLWAPYKLRASSRYNVLFWTHQTCASQLQGFVVCWLHFCVDAVCAALTQSTWDHFVLRFEQFALVYQLPAHVCNRIELDRSNKYESRAKLTRPQWWMEVEFDVIMSWYIFPLRYDALLPEQQHCPRDTLWYNGMQQLACIANWLSCVARLHFIWQTSNEMLSTASYDDKRKNYIILGYTHNYSSETAFFNHIFSQ
jgi:hypothetical protein